MRPASQNTTVDDSFSRAESSKMQPMRTFLADDDIANSYCSDPEKGALHPAARFPTLRMVRASPITPQHGSVPDENAERARCDGRFGVFRYVLGRSATFLAEPSGPIVTGSRPSLN